MNSNLTGRVALITSSVQGVGLANAKARVHPHPQNSNTAQRIFSPNGTNIFDDAFT